MSTKTIGSDPWEQLIAKASVKAPTRPAGGLSLEEILVKYKMPENRGRKVVSRLLASGEIKRVLGTKLVGGSNRLTACPYYVPVKPAGR